MEEIKKMLADQAVAIAELRTKNDERLKQLETKGIADPLTTAAVKQANDAISSLDDKLKAVQIAMKRRAEAGVDAEGREKKAELVAHQEAFINWMRKSNNGRMADALQEAQQKAIEAKALSVGSDVDGGFYVTPDTSGRIVKQVYETSQMRAIASVQTIGTDKLEGQYDRDEVGAEWEGETVAGSEATTPQIGKWSIQVHTLKSRPKATQQLLEDANVNVEAWLADHTGRKFARKEENTFLVGNGVNKPRGMMTYPSGTAHQQIQRIHSGSISAITDPDKILALIYALKAEYRNNAVFGFSRQGIQDLRTMKQDNKYVWVDMFGGGGPGLASQPAKLFGYPVYEMNDLAAFASASLSGFFGDIKETYQIVDRAGIRVLRDPYTAEPFVKFITSKRVGGDVVNFESVKFLEMST